MALLWAGVLAPAAEQLPALLLPKPRVIGTLFSRVRRSPAGR